MAQPIIAKAIPSCPDWRTTIGFARVFGSGDGNATSTCKWRCSNNGSNTCNELYSNVSNDAILFTPEMAQANVTWWGVSH